MTRHLVLFLFLFFCFSCGQKPAEEVREAIDVAQTLLSENKCQEAIDLLEDVGRQPDDAIYIQVLASAYACRAGFDTVNFVANDLPAIVSASFFKSISILSLSAQTVVDSGSYTDLETAFTILEATDKQVNRNSSFGARKAGDIGVQLLLLSIVQLGKFLHYFGDVDALGNKSLGPVSNECFINYTHGPAIAAVTMGTTGACTSNNKGHPDMNGAQLRRRLCEGSTLIANIVDVIKNIDLSASSSLSSLESLTATVDNYRADSDAAGVGHLIDLTSQADCEALLLNAAQMNNMQLYYATVFEVGLQ